MDVSVRWKIQPRWDVPTARQCEQAANQNNQGLWKINDERVAAGLPIHETWYGWVRDLMLHGY